MARADSRLRERVIFVVGARRSGTNWLERILTAHPEVVAVPTETYIFSHGIEPLTERFQHANPSAPVMGRTFVSRDALIDGARELVDRVLLETLELQDPNARYIVERTPWHASHLPLIAEVYPDAHVLHIVRDGRAVARSLVSMPWGPESIEEAAAEWSKTIRDARAGGASLGDRYREVVYEDMVGDPRARTREVFDWLGLELTDATWRRILSEAGAEFNVDPGSPGIRTDKWRDELSQSELRAIERVAGAELDLLGYERATASGAARGTEPVGAKIRTAARVLARPRSSLRERRARRFARRLHVDQIAHNETVARFERLVASGDEGPARALLGKRVWVRIDEGSGPRESRGAEAADALLDALAGHGAREVRMLSGQTHASPYAVTTIATYELSGGEVWTRSLVYGTTGGQIRSVGLYRHQLAPAERPAAATV